MTFLRVTGVNRPGVDGEGMGRREVVALGSILGPPVEEPTALPTGHLPTAGSDFF